MKILSGGAACVLARPQTSGGGFSIGMFPLMLTVLSGDFNRGYQNPD